MVDSYRKVSINNLELRVPSAPLHDLSACGNAQAERIQLRISPDKESGLSEVRFWHEGKLLGSRKVKNRVECTPPTRHIYRKNKTCCIIR